MLQEIYCKATGGFWSTPPTVLNKQILLLWFALDLIILFMVSSGLITTATAVLPFREKVIREKVLQIALWWYCSEGSPNLLFLQAGPCSPRACNLQQGCLAFHLKLSPCLLGSTIQSLDISSPLQYPCWKSYAQIWLNFKGVWGVLKALSVVEKLDFKTLYYRKLNRILVFLKYQWK